MFMDLCPKFFNLRRTSSWAAGEVSRRPENKGDLFFVQGSMVGEMEVVLEQVVMVGLPGQLTLFLKNRRYSFEVPEREDLLFNAVSSCLFQVLFSIDVMRGISGRAFFALR